MRPTVWIVLTAIFALAAVGLGAWAISAQNDADEAETDALRAEFDAARTCLKSTLDVLDQALDSGGLEAAAAELEQLSGTCRKAAP